MSISAISIIGWLGVCDVRGSSGSRMDGRDSIVFNIMVVRRRLSVADGPVVRHSCLFRIVFRSASGKWSVNGGQEQIGCGRSHLGCVSGVLSGIHVL